jgi:hypothetical protein
MDLRPWEFDSPLGHQNRSLNKEEAIMEQSFGEFILRAVPLLIVASAAVPLVIIYRYIKTKYEDGPDHRNS